jgi:hypothetical protein
MDVEKALRELYEEKKRLDRAIAALEAGMDTAAGRTGGRRGRRSMGADERKEVSKRMARYWAQRRARERNDSTPASRSAGSAVDSGAERALAEAIA